jgi:hypothetical protein
MPLIGHPTRDGNFLVSMRTGCGDRIAHDKMFFYLGYSGHCRRVSW